MEVVRAGVTLFQTPGNLRQSTNIRSLSRWSFSRKGTLKQKVGFEGAAPRVSLFLLAPVAGKRFA